MAQGVKEVATNPEDLSSIPGPTRKLSSDLHTHRHIYKNVRKNKNQEMGVGG